MHTQLDNPQQLQCMEVWGDNGPVDKAVVMPGLDAWVHSRPAGNDEAGGDVHYVSSCATGRIIRILIADVSGHGAEVATIADRLRGLMRRYMNNDDQRKLLTDINREFLGLTHTSQFATALVLTCWTPTGEITLSCAGHPAPIVYRDASARWEPLFAPGEHANIPLGIQKDAVFEQTPIELAPDDLLLAFTDGIIEARDAGGRMLGSAGLVDILNALDDRPAQSVLPHIARAVAARAEGDAAFDDISLLLVRRNHLHAPTSIVSEIAGSARLARAMAASITKPSTAPLPRVNRAHLLGTITGRHNRT